MSERPLLPLWAAVGVAAVAGLALDGALPSLGWWPLAFVSVILGLLTLIGRRVGGAILVGAVYGLCFFTPNVSFISRFLGDMPLGWLPWIALAVLESLILAVLSPLITLAYRWTPRVRDTKAVRVIVLPLLVAGLWTGRELILGSAPYGGFPWGRLGMTQSASPFATVASWLSVDGLSFCIVLVCAMAIEAVRWAARPNPTPGVGDSLGVRGVKTLLPMIGLAFAMLVIPQFPTAPAGTMLVGAAQGNGPTAYIDERPPLSVINSQLDASRPLETERVDIVVWPEGSVDHDPLQDRQIAAMLDAASRRYGAPILMNSASADGELVYNTSFLWTENGAVAQHAKRHPVPFGEYVPDREFYEKIVPDLIGLLGRGYSPGTNPPVMNVDGTTIGLAICFDVIFDDVPREAVQRGAQVFLLQTNNADFRGTDENLQQVAFARMRAIETGRTVVNLSTTGTSQAIGPDGTILETIPVDESGLIVIEIELRDGLTPATVIGPAVELVLLWGSLLGLALVAILAARSRD